MSDRIVVMDAGVVRQVGTPEEIYDAPADVFVADFVGTINLLDVTCATDRGDHIEVAVPGVPVPCGSTRVGAETSPADVGIIGFRPESVLVHESCAAGHHDSSTIADSRRNPMMPTWLGSAPSCR